MKVLYFLALVVVCLAAPTDSPPKNVRATVYQEDGKIYFRATWDKVDSINGNPVLGYYLKVYRGQLYVNYEVKDDGSKVTEVYAPTNPEKPITEIDEFDIPADQTEFTYENMEKSVVYQIAVQGYSAAGRGQLSDYYMFSFL